MALSAWTSFGSDEYTLGNIKTQGWSDEWISTGDRTIVEDLSADDGRAAYMFRSGSSIRKMLIWDQFTSDGDLDKVELVARTRSENESSSPSTGLAAFGAGGNGSETGYVASIYGASQDELRIYRYSAGSSSVLASASVSITAKSYFLMRFRVVVNGDGDIELSVKVWTGDVDDEPGAWTLTYTDDSGGKLSPGTVGIYCFANESRHDWIGIATGGGTAPTSAGGGSPDRTGALSVDLDGATLSAIGIFPPTGSLSGTLGAVALSAAGTLPLTGSLSLSLGSLDASATGKLAIAGSASITLAPVALASAGKLRIDGSVSGSLAPMVLSASATLTGGPGGRVSVALGALSLNSSGALSTEGSAGIHLSPLTAQATGKLLIYGELNASLGTLALSTDSGDIPIPSRFYGVDLGGQLPKDVLEAAITTGRPIEIRISDIVYNDPLSVTSGIEAILAYLKTKETRPIA